MVLVVRTGFCKPKYARTARLIAFCPSSSSALGTVQPILVQVPPGVKAGQQLQACGFRLVALFFLKQNSTPKCSNRILPGVVFLASKGDPRVRRWSTGRHASFRCLPGSNAYGTAACYCPTWSCSRTDLLIHTWDTSTSCGGGNRCGDTLS